MKPSDLRPFALVFIREVCHDMAWPREFFKFALFLVLTSGSAAYAADSAANALRSWGQLGKMGYRMSQAGLRR
jgi:hypothetical protein